MFVVVFTFVPLVLPWLVVEFVVFVIVFTRVGVCVHGGIVRVNYPVVVVLGVVLVTVGVRRICVMFVLLMVGVFLVVVWPFSFYCWFMLFLLLFLFVFVVVFCWRSCLCSCPCACSCSCCRVW